VRAQRVRLRDFRSYERAEAELGDGLTVVIGPNGAGKTNLLEAVYFSLTSRACRTSNERELVRLGAQLTRTEAEVAAVDGSHLLEVGFQPGEPKRLRIDGAPVERFGPDTPRPLTVVFLPERLELVRGGPSLTWTSSPPHSTRRSATCARVTRGPSLSATRSWHVAAQRLRCSTRGTRSWPSSAGS
jgi:DNA replication and repair protein RecF